MCFDTLTALQKSSLSAESHTVNSGDSGLSTRCEVATSHPVPRLITRRSQRRLDSIRRFSTGVAVLRLWVTTAVYLFIYGLNDMNAPLFIVVIL